MPSVTALRRGPGRPAGTTDLKPEIIRAAEIAFAHYGFDATSIRQIAQSVNVSPAAVLHHYGTKRRLYAEVLRRISDSLETHPILSNPTGPGEESLHRVIDALRDGLRDGAGQAR